MLLLALMPRWRGSARTYGLVHVDSAGDVLVTVDESNALPLVRDGPNQLVLIEPDVNDVSLMWGCTGYVVNRLG